MSKQKLTARSNFAALLAEVKGRIQSAQTREVLAVNAELVRLYWDIGRLINDRQQHEGWGTAVIPKLAAELRNELPNLKGFSERNIQRMVAFFRDSPEPAAILPPPVAPLPAPAKVPQPVAEVANSLIWSVPLRRGFFCRHCKS